MQQLLGKQNYAEFRKKVGQCQTLEQKLQLARQHYQNYQGEPRPVISDIITWLLLRFPSCYSQQFLPSERNITAHQRRFLEDSLRCGNCGNYLTRHIQVLPCRHVLCDVCCFKLQTECVMCHGQIADLSIDSRVIVKGQLNFPVQCCYGAQQQLFTYGIVEQQACTDLTPRQQRVVARINDSRDNTMYQHLNALRSANAQKIISGAKRVHLEIRSQVQNFSENNQFEVFRYIDREVTTENSKRCTQVVTYKDILSHIRQDCKSRVVFCKNRSRGCNCMLPRGIIREHESQCRYNRRFCRLCLQYSGLMYHNIAFHELACIDSLVAAVERSPIIPVQRDALVELKTNLLIQSFNRLYGVLLLYFTKMQEDIINQHNEIVQNPRGARGRLGYQSKLFMFLSSIFRERQALRCLSIHCVFITVYDLLDQLSVWNSGQLALLFSILLILYVALFLAYFVSYMKSNLYKSTAFIMVFVAYCCLVVDFAGIYAFIALFDRNSFTNVRAPNVYDMYIDMLYYSAITSAKSGFGDMHPQLLSVKIIVIVQILASIFVLYIIFRGGNFYFRIQTMRREIRDMRRQLQVIETVLYRKDFNV